MADTVIDTARRLRSQRKAETAPAERSNAASTVRPRRPVPTSSFAPRGTDGPREFGTPIQEPLLRMREGQSTDSNNSS